MKVTFLLLLTCFCLASNAQEKGQVPYQTTSLKNEAITEVEVETSGGNIAVTGAPASEARIEVYISGNNNRGGNADLSKEEIKSRLDADYDLDVSVTNGKVTARAKPKRANMNWKAGLSISFVLFTPETVATDLTTSGGNIQLTNLSGAKRFTTSGGNLRIDKVRGKTTGRTSGGNIYINASTEAIDLSTSGGNVEAADCTGDLHLTTSGGSVKLHNLNGTIEATTSGGNVDGENIEGDLNAHTSGGNIDLSGLACSLETSTSGGHIDVALRDVSKPIKISNSGGNINLQLPKGASADLNIQADKVSAGKLDAFSGTIEDDEISGKLNGGGATVRVRAGSGRVSLSFK